MNVSRFSYRFFKLLVLFDLEYSTIKYSSQIEKFHSQARTKFILYKVHFN